MHPSRRPDVEAAVRPAAGRGDRLPAPESAGGQRRGRPRDRPPDRSASGAGTRADARGRRGAGDDRRLVGARKQGRSPMRERGPPGTSQQGGGLSHAQASQGREVGSLFAGETAALMRTVDWSATPLGPVESWPPTLRSALSVCVGSPVPMMIWWGPELAPLYNDAYRPILGSRKHPRALGRPGRECWLAIWNVIGPMLEGALRRGEATFSHDLLLPLDRHGYREECYFTLSFSPIRDEAGGVHGVFTTAAETTQRVLGERRLRTLRDLALRAAEARTTEQACESAVRALAANPGDIPFALLYLLAADGKRARLAGATGVAPHMAPPRVVLAETGSRGTTRPLAQVARTGRGVQINDPGARLEALPISLWGDVPH